MPHPKKKMIFLPARKLTSILGVTEDEMPMSTEDKWLREKYMGRWIWVETLIRRMVLRFPYTVTR